MSADRRLCPADESTLETKRYARTFIRFMPLTPCVLVRVAAAAITFSSLVNAAPGPTLESLRAKYLNQPVVLRGKIEKTFQGKEVLVNWFPAAEGRINGTPWYVSDNQALPSSYLNQAGEVIAIQLDGDVPDRNALGESIDNGSVSPLDVSVVVRLSNNQLALSKVVVDLISEHLRLESELANVRAMMSQQLSQLSGTRIYAVAYSELYSTDLSIDEIKDGHAIFKRISDIPLLDGLEVVVAQYIENADAVIFKVRLPDGRFALGYQISTDWLSNRDLMHAIAPSFLAAVPNLSEQEIEAVRSRRIFRGMSELALHYSWGSRNL